MSTAPQSKNIRTTYTLSAAALTIAALTLTGCAQLAAQNAPGAASDAGVPAAATEARPATEAGAPKTAASDASGTGMSTTDTAAPAAAAPAAAMPAAPAIQPAVALQPQGTVATTTSSTTLAVQTAQTIGSYQPSASTTGVPAGTALKPYNTTGADLVITQDGTVLSGLDIYGDIKVRAKNVTIQNSRLHGGKAIPKSNTGVVDANSAAVVNLVVQDSTIIPDSPSYYRDGIVGHDYTARRNHIQGSNDGLGIFNRPGGPVAANVTAEGNYIHGLTYFSNDPAHSDGTHNDGIQVQGGENIRLVGNNVVANSTPGAGSAPNPRGTHAGTGIILQQNVAKLANVVVDKNWVDDGQTSINIDNGKYSNITVTLSGNKLGRNQFDFGNGSKYPVRIISRAASTVSGLATNRWADNLVLLVEGKTGGIRYNY
jgi:hypothetical protein